MFAILVELLAGRYVATAYNDRDCVEWPPHPARLFSALVATWAGGDAQSSLGVQERAALEWLEQQDPPDILASSDESTAIRTVTQVFVPVNDASVLSEPDREKLDAATAALSETQDLKTRTKREKNVMKLQQKLATDTAKAIAEPLRVGKDDVASALRLFPERRTRKPRTFPSVTPEVPSFAFVWSAAQPSEISRHALDRLLRATSRLGHSSTPVAARIVAENALAVLAAQTQRMVPNDNRGDTMIRWVSPGQVQRLVEAFERHRETEPRVLPARFVRYCADAPAPEVSAISSVFDPELLVFARVGGPRLPITSAAGLSRQLRRALMACAEEPIAEMLSGHRPDGSSSGQPHLAIVPLPVVGSRHADGAILGMALVFPRGCPGERRAVLRAVDGLERKYRTPDDDEASAIGLELGDSGRLELQRVVWHAPSRTLRSDWWCKPSRHWASATPIALDKNPGDLHDSNPERRRAAFAEASAIVREAVRRVVPDDGGTVIELDVVRSCVMPGTAKPNSYPRFPIDRSRPQRVLVHARVVFAKPVRGPLLLGAGRYQGLGLCLPVDERASTDGTDDT